MELRTAPYYTTKSSSLKRKKLVLNKETGKYEKAFKEFKWTDFTKLREIYTPYVNGKYEIIYSIEKVFTKYGESHYTAFIFGDSCGIHRGQCSYLNPVEFYNPTPEEWKSYFGLSGDKELSVLKANEIFEAFLKEFGIGLLKFQKSNRNKHVDLSESLLLSLYGLIQYQTVL